MPLFFAFTLFVSATLLFMVQPMIARMILPLLGGTPAVWNTCMVFFQAALLAGYAYAHATPEWFGRRRQIVVHGLLLLLPLAFLPLGVASGWTPPTEGNPILWLLLLLTASVGLPFFLVATSAPLLQSWFAASGHASARDPYFLYGASNLGSMLALLGYPTLVEPFLTLQMQSLLWTAGYVMLALLTLGCAFLGTRNAADSLHESRAPREDTEPQSARGASELQSTGTCFRWIALAFVPSSLMLGVTTYFTTDIAAIPLLWVVPLAIYLLSFILVFARRPWISHETYCRVWPAVLVGLVFLMVSAGTHEMHTGVVMLAHLLALFVAAMVCHGELARLRPHPSRLTAFYLCMSLGGVLGGLFNALAAPLLFTHVIEYPLALVCACFVLPALSPSSTTAQRRLDVALPALVALLTAGLILGLTGTSDGVDASLSFLRAFPGAVSALIVFLPALLLCFTFSDRPLRFGLAVGAVLFTSLACKELKSQVLHRERGFFGDLHVRHDPTGAYIQMVHGTTLHGMQSRDPSLRGEPLTYFHKTGPIGQIFMVLNETPSLTSSGHDANGAGLKSGKRRVGVTGLGVGVLASYARPGEDWTYYEIDPAVSRVAWDTRFFTYLQDAQDRGVGMRVIHGDARLRMEDARKGEYDLIVLDAFSSDSVPVHLLTRQAGRLYQNKLAEGGWLVFNISNRYLRLEPVLAALAEDAGLFAMVCYDTAPSDVPGKMPSAWVVMARTETDLVALRHQSGWRPAEREARVELWTDDFSNLLSIFIWR